MTTTIVVCCRLFQMADIASDIVDDVDRHDKEPSHPYLGSTVAKTIVLASNCSEIVALGVGASNTSFLVIKAVEVIARLFLCVSDAIKSKNALNLRDRTIRPLPFLKMMLPSLSSLFRTLIEFTTYADTQYLEKLYKLRATVEPSATGEIEFNTQKGLLENINTVEKDIQQLQGSVCLANIIELEIKAKHEKWQIGELSPRACATQELYKSLSKQLRPVN